MATPIRSIINSVLPKKDILDLISFVNYPYFDWMLSQVPHNIHMYKGDRLPYNWDENILSIPNNVTFDINPDLPLGLDIDLVLCHNRLQQFDISKIFSTFWHLPICLVHQLLPRDMKYHNQWQNIAPRVGNSNIFLSRKIQEEWNIPGYIIPPGIPNIAGGKNKQNKVAYIYCLVDEPKKVIKQNLGDIGFIEHGDFNKYQIVVNSTTMFYPIHALVAMAHGCCVITQEIPEMDEVFKDGENCLIYKDIPHLRVMIESVNNKPSMYEEIGARAREMVRTTFPMDEFRKKMNVAIKQSAEIMYTR